MIENSEIAELKKKVESLTAMIEELKRPRIPELEQIRHIREVAWGLQSEDRKAKITAINEYMGKFIVPVVLDNPDFEKIRLGQGGLSATGLFSEVTGESLDKMMSDIDFDFRYRQALDALSEKARYHVRIINEYLTVNTADGLPFPEVIEKIKAGDLAGLAEYELLRIVEVVRMKERDAIEAKRIQDANLARVVRI